MTTTMMIQKRKRDKAQEQLRSRMRQRGEGHGTSSTMLQARRRYTFRDGKRDTSLSGGMMNKASSITVTPGDLLGTNYMHWQPDMLPSSGGVVSDRTQSDIKGADPIPMSELIKRVLQRKVDNLELGSSILPIGNLKSRHVPYALRHSSHIKKILGTMSKHKAKESTNKPIVVVADIKETDANGQQRLRSHAKLKNQLKPRPTIESTPSIQDDSQGSSASRTSSKIDEPQTRRLPSDQNLPDPLGQPHRGNDILSNYRLQTTRAKKMIGKQMALQHRDTRKQTLNERAMQKPKPLPAIKSETNSSKRDKNLTSRLIEDAVIKSKTRCSSGDDIINLKTAQSEAMQKLEDMGEPTLLGTPRRSTHKMLRFKNNLGKVDRLLAIEEDK
ncbi:uncharacterized protein LOC105445798 [Strongylocentrotus purpuratus]|uniref:Uncharacterized protein n=1 Tax=Strongylocentrotus purpuratus TaxID=7668 RepID=A0A7M7PT27_STRPU|nr:uncharacterized protein LOC105445798 [Strongylocentrotus purpuratus]XP_030856310.1 uncharacterized protein LOC105445798 [Strongylocentrotus purpuratus]